MGYYRILRAVRTLITNEKNFIPDLAYKAYLCGERKHSRQKVQEMLLNNFTTSIETGEKC